MTTARDRWLDEGLRTLATEGAAGVRIDRIAARLGLSKGSFHHHFAGAEGYKRDLLARYEALSVDAVESAVAAAGVDASTRDVLQVLTARVGADHAALFRPELDVAVRAWSATDGEVRAVQQRIDTARIDALTRVWQRVVPDPVEARRAATLPYLVAVGAAMVVPPTDANELRALYELLLGLVPGSS
ncbi:MAG TPA: TetR/AcrR family transcriptional regulator [Microlunatus sp.]|nr:TetR/AcrR family transcriptional regulator [Microlunatus sp.]